MSQKVTGNEYRTTLVCVDSYDNEQMQGRLFNPYLTGTAEFTSIIQFLSKMDTMLDEMQFPQSFSARRSFAPVERELSSEQGGGKPRGKCATFAIRVLFRQNASWQGSVSWLDGRREESFRSVLELLFLMDSALKTEQKTKIS